MSRRLELERHEGRDAALAAWKLWCVVQLAIAAVALPHVQVWPGGWLPGVGAFHDALFAEAMAERNTEHASARRAQG